MSDQDATTPADDREAGIAGFISHLVELRNRLLKSVLVILVLFLALFPLRNDLFAWLSEPLSRDLPAGTTMIAVQVASPFFIPLKLTALTAVFIAIPYLLYQLWAFIAPGLYKHERKLVAPLVFSSTILFYMGTAFAYFVVFPVVFGFLSSTGPSDVNFAPDIGEYLSFVTTLFFAFGFVFEVPVATVLLVLVGATTPAQLAEKRRYAILVAFIIGAVFTPPDVLSQFMMAVPVWLLYEIGIIVGRIVYRQKKEIQAASEDDEAAAEGETTSEPSDGDEQGAATASDDETDADVRTSASSPGQVTTFDDDDEDIDSRHRRYETEADDEDFDFDKAFDEAEREQQELRDAGEQDDTDAEGERDEEEGEKPASDRPSDDGEDKDEDESGDERKPRNPKDDPKGD